VFFYRYKGDVFTPFVFKVADRVGLRTVDACEPRQIRKEAAAAGYARVAVLSGSVSSSFAIIQLTCFLSDSGIRDAHVQEHTPRFFFAREQISGTLNGDNGMLKCSMLPLFSWRYGFISFSFPIWYWIGIFSNSGLGPL